MARLIDADALLENVENLKSNLYGWQDYNTGVEGAVYKIETAPTVDAVEVVRCKDCKHCYKATFSSTGYRCKVWGVYDTDCEVTPEHYCSYGERKDND